MTRKRQGIYMMRIPEFGDPAKAGREDEEWKPGLIVSWNAVNGGIKKPVVAAITSQPRDRNLPTYVVLEPEESDGGVSETSYILCHALHTLDEKDLDSRPKGWITRQKMYEVEAAIARALDFRGANPPPSPE